jgi:hypothetical protein
VSAICVDTGHCADKTTDPLDNATVSQIADTIFRVENSRTHPYSVMIPTRHPRAVCINTIQHAWVDFERGEVETGTKDAVSKHPLFTATSLPLITFLGSRYCPPSVDPVGNKNWIHNVYYILNHK